MSGWEEKEGREKAAGRALGPNQGGLFKEAELTLGKLFDAVMAVIH